jgi:hypothetical protein
MRRASEGGSAVRQQLIARTLALVFALTAASAIGTGPALGAPLRPGFDGISDTPSATQPHWVCPQGVCDAIADPRPAEDGSNLAAVYGGHKPEGSGKLGGYAPKDLRSAYAIPATGGAGQTVAVVEGFVYRQAEKDLAEYRSHYGLPPCTSKSGCLTIVNGHGAPPKYSPFSGWELEVALDLDMVSSACQECHIILVDSEEESWRALGTGVNRAATLGATEISNSYGLAEETCEGKECTETASDWNHPGIFTTVSAGDSGWNYFEEGFDSPSFPADLPTVAAIGGTALRRAKNAKGKRAFTEKVWDESGSGCSLSPKPSWQLDSGCPGRTENDVAAVGACETPVSVYSSPEGGWENVCGTSVSSPLIAAIEAHASPYSRSLPGGEAFYEPGASLFDVKSGSDGRCPRAQKYLCTAGKGYDGPTGNGTPDGPLLLEP